MMSATTNRRIPCLGWCVSPRSPPVFTNARHFIEWLEHFIASEQHPVRQVIIDARAIPSIDVTAAE
jgi:hypothetical protein